MHTVDAITFHKPNHDELVKISRLNVARVPRSDFSLGYLYAHYPMNGNFSCHFFSEDTAAVRFGKDEDVKKEYALISSKETSADEYKLLIEYIQRNNEHDSFIGSIDKHDYERIKDLQFIVQNRLVRDRDNDEYILSSMDHTRYKTSGLSAERRAVSNFMKKYSEDIRYYELDLGRHDATSLLLNAYSSWSKIYKNNNNDLDNIQYRYISQLLFHAKEIGLKNLTICHNEQIIGFGLYETVPELNTILFHILKVDYAFDHSFDFGIHVASNMFLSAGYTQINIEDDAGIVGIRNKKMSMSPVKFIEKWNYRFLDLPQ